MKKSIFTLIALLFAATLSAQTLPSAEERAKASADHLRTTLGLDSKQYAKIYKAYLKYMRREDKRMEQSMAEREATERSIKSVLSTEQVARFEREGQKDVISPRQPLNRNPNIEPLQRHPRRTNMYIERE